VNERDERLVRDALADQRRDQFADGFADRAAARWRASRAVDAAPVGALMTRQFVRLLPFAIAATLLLAVNNLRHREVDRGQTIVQALLGITPRTPSTPARAVTLYALYGLDASMLSPRE